MPPTSWDCWGKLRRPEGGLRVKIWAASAKSRALGRDIEAGNRQVLWACAADVTKSLAQLCICSLWFCSSV